MSDHSRMSIDSLPDLAVSPSRCASTSRGRAARSYPPSRTARTRPPQISAASSAQALTPLPEPLLAHAHAAQRVPCQASKPGDGGSRRTSGRSRAAPGRCAREGGGVDVVAAAGGQRHVRVAPRPAPVRSRPRPGAGVEGGTGGCWHRRRRRALFEDVLGAVAVVDVEVEDRDPAAPCCRRRCFGATATLLKKQKPMAVARSAWWRAGRTAANAGTARCSHPVGGGQSGFDRRPRASRCAAGAGCPPSRSASPRAPPPAPGDRRSPRRGPRGPRAAARRWRPRFPRTASRGRAGGRRFRSAGPAARDSRAARRARGSGGR